MRYKYIILMLLCFCFVHKAYSQQTFVVRGVISRSVSVERIAQVLITNLRSRDIMMSDELGWFSIQAAIGDTLLFSKINYTDQKVIIIAPGDIPVYMQPVIQLDQVTIKGQTTRQELNEAMNNYRRKGVYFDGKPPVLSYLVSPLNGLYELFGKDPNRMRRFANYSKGELEYAELRKRYNVGVVMRVTGTTDTVAKKFMEYYTPSYEDLKGWNDYELIKQIKSAYEFYDKSKDKEKLQQLNQPTFIKPKQQQP